MCPVQTALQHLVKLVTKLLRNVSEDDVDGPLPRPFLHPVMRIQQLKCHSNRQERSRMYILVTEPGNQQVLDALV